MNNQSGLVIYDFNINLEKCNCNTSPVMAPPSGVLTPDPLFTAVRANDAVRGIDLTKEPMKLQAPRAKSTCVASTDLPFAETTREKRMMWLEA